MSVKKAIVNGLEVSLRWAYKWLSDNDDVLGKILSTLHILVLIVIFVLIVISHVIYPVIWLQLFVFGIVFLIWLQHVLLHACVCSSLERKLMGDDAPLAIDIILNILRIPISKETRMGLTVLLSSLTVGFLGLELIARGVMYLRDELKLSPWG